MEKKTKYELLAVALGAIAGCIIAHFAGQKYSGFDTDSFSYAGGEPGSGGTGDTTAAAKDNMPMHNNDDQGMSKVPKMKKPLNRADMFWKAYHNEGPAQEKMQLDWYKFMHMGAPAPSAEQAYDYFETQGKKRDAMAKKMWATSHGQKPESAENFWTKSQTSNSPEQRQLLFNIFFPQKKVNKEGEEKVYAKS